MPPSFRVALAGMQWSASLARYSGGTGTPTFVVLRSDQLALQERLQGWRWFAADPPVSLVGEWLPPHVHDTWAYRIGRDRWELQVMIQESEEDSWLFRRDRRIRGPLADFVLWHGSSVTYS